MTASLSSVFRLRKVISIIDLTACAHTKMASSLFSGRMSISNGSIFSKRKLMILSSIFLKCE